MCLLVVSVAAQTHWGVGRIVGTVENSQVTESSGLAASWRNPGLYWTHNDSGDSARVFLMDRTGRDCGTWEVSGALNRDWEDMAVGPGPVSGSSYLYLGDIGDNGRRRRDVVVYRVPEPDAASHGGRLGPAVGLHFVYPDQPHDAETLLVHPKTGRIYIVIKAHAGDAETLVFRAPAKLPATGSATLERVAKLELPPEFDLTSITGRITGGSISKDGRRLLLCDYLRGYEFVLPPGKDFDRIWSQQPEVIDPGSRKQGESVAYRLDGKSLLLTSEGASSPVVEVVRQAP